MSGNPSLFARLTGGGSAPSQPVRTPPAAPSAPSNPPAADVPPLTGAPAQPSGDNPPAPAPAQPNTPPALSVADLLRGGGETQPEGGEVNPVDYANSIVEALSSGTIEEPDSSVPRVNVDAMRDAFGQVDFTMGVDMNQLLQQLQDPENGAQALQNAMQQNSMNVLTAFAPLVNQLVEQAVTRSQQAAITASSNNMLRDSIVTAFMNKHPYANNPLASRMLNEVANTLVQSAPRGTPVENYVNVIHQMFSGISQGVGQPQQSGPGQQNHPQGAQSDFTGLFG